MAIGIEGDHKALHVTGALEHCWMPHLLNYRTEMGIIWVWEEFTRQGRLGLTQDPGAAVVLQQKKNHQGLAGKRKRKGTLGSHQGQEPPGAEWGRSNP